MPNGVRKSGKTAHANNQRAKMEQKYLEKMETLQLDFQKEIGVKSDEIQRLREKSKELTDALAKAEGRDLGEVASLKKKLSSARITINEQAKEISEMKGKIKELKDQLYDPETDDALSQMIKEMWNTDTLCSLCRGVELQHPHKHNAAPLTQGFCCSKCNAEKVIPFRLAKVQGWRRE